MTTESPTGRLVSLDQFRGYTVLGMFLVNFVSGYEHVPRWLRFEHTYFSYHDSIMPQFFLAFGFSLRLSFLRRSEVDGPTAAYWKSIKRGLGLILLGIVFYQFTTRFNSWDQMTDSWRRDGAGAFLLNTIKRTPFETLTHIGVTALFVLPVIAQPGWVRALFAVVAAAVHVWISLSGYYAWTMSDPVGIDGGPLGFLTWTIPVIAGTLAHDWMIGDPANSMRGMDRVLAWSVVLMLLGYGLSCLNRVMPPNVLPDDASFADRLAPLPLVPPADAAAAQAGKNYWTMSTRASSVTYHLFGAGFGLVVLAAFRLVSDRWQLRWPFLNLLSRNALAAYLLHGIVGECVKRFVPRDAPGAAIWIGFAVYLAMIAVLLRYLDRNRLYLRL